MIIEKMTHIHDSENRLFHFYAIRYQSYLRGYSSENKKRSGYKTTKNTAANPTKRRHNKTANIQNGESYETANLQDSEYDKTVNSKKIFNTTSSLNIANIQ